MLPPGAAAAAGSKGGLMRPAVEVATGPPPKRYKVTMLGAPGVGKSALTSQFLSSDHMNTYDNVGESVSQSISPNPKRYVSCNHVKSTSYRVR